LLIFRFPFGLVRMEEQNFWDYNCVSGQLNLAESIVTDGSAIPSVLYYDNLFLSYRIRTIKQSYVRILNF
jgi:hypothetical protein